MTNPNLTLIGVLVDRSGSMHSIKQDMEGGIKRFLSDQYKLGDTEVAVGQFSNSFEVTTPIRKLLEDETIEIVPTSMTALNDAIGEFTTYLGQQLAARNEENRPGKVIITIITDGYENASKEWSLEQVRDLIKQQEEKYGWEFVFMGSELNTEKQARGYGIGANRTVRYRQSTEGVDSGASMLSNMTAHIRQQPANSNQTS